MMREVFVASIAAVALTAAAEAQDSLGRQQKPVPPEEMRTPPINPPNSWPRARTAPGSDVSAQVSQFAPGMAVEDRMGVGIGEIAQSGETADGTWGVVVIIDGQPYNLSSSSLALSASGDRAVSALTKAEIKATAKPKP